MLTLNAFVRTEQLEGSQFGDSNLRSNGELQFFNNIRTKINSIFDVGSNIDSPYIDFHGEVHYFEPLPLIHELVIKSNKNKKAIFNNFGLSDISDKNREVIWETGGNLPGGAEEKLHPVGCTPTMSTMTGEDYMVKNHISEVDFLKIDVEGHELHIIRGFNEFLNSIKIVQFEYGRTTFICGTRMIDIISHLRKFGFKDFSYISPLGLIPLNSTEDHFNFCNIVCFKRKKALYE